MMNDITCKITREIAVLSRNSGGWQRYLELPAMPVGTRLRLRYEQNRKGVHLGKVTRI